MYKKTSRFRFLFGAIASLTAHGAALGAAAYLLAPEPKPPKPFALQAIKKIVTNKGLELEQSSRLVCASFPFVCEEERFVTLEIEELKEPDPIEEKINELTKPDPTKPEVFEDEKLKPEEKKPEEKKPEEKKPEEKKPEEQALVMTPPPPVVQPKERPKSVEQLVEKEDKFNPDPKFLAEKTHIVEEQTQAKVTSDHIMDKKAVAVSDPDASEEKEDAGSEEKKVASVQEKAAKATETKSQVFKENKVDPVAVVTAAPGQNKEGKAGEKGQTDPTEKLAIDPTGLGEIAAATPKMIGDGGTEGKGTEGAGKGGKNDNTLNKKGQPRLNLTMSDFQQLYGKSEDAKEGQQETLATNKGGKTSKREKFVMAQLENYLPEVKPGNQTALSTAADPFAKFLHQMHLRIHKQWGDGVLRDFDSMGGTNAINNPTLQVTLEIAINPDGTLDKAAPIGSSGYLAYDLAAVTAVFDAAPFPVPNEQIRSYNGKTYVRWTLHRDNRQCATSFAEPFIIAGTEVKGATPPPKTELPVQPGDNN